MPNPVTVRKLKFDGSLVSEWQGDLVEAIADRWLVTRHSSPPVTKPGSVLSVPGLVAEALRYNGVREPLSVLVSFDHLGAVLEYHCDSGLPATLRGRTIEFVDLDLDLMVTPGLETTLRDEDDFSRRSREMAYSDGARAAAREGIRLARQLVAAREEPFDGSPAALLGRLLAAEGPL